MTFLLDSRAEKHGLHSRKTALTKDIRVRSVPKIGDGLRNRELNVAASERLVTSGTTSFSIDRNLDAQVPADFTGWLADQARSFSFTANTLAL
jgi:hypothetical protein